MNLNKVSKLKQLNHDELAYKINQENLDKYFLSNSAVLMPSKKLNQKSLSGIVSYMKKDLNPVDFNILNDKLKLVQNNNGNNLIQAPTPSSNLPTKTSKLKKASSNHQSDLIDTDRISLKLKNSSRKEFQRSLSTMESHKIFENFKNKIVPKNEKSDRAQSQLSYSNGTDLNKVFMNHEPIYEDLKEESANCYSKSCEIKNKSSHEAKRANNRHVSMMSLRSPSPISSSLSIRSETDSASLSCSPRSSTNSINCQRVNHINHKLKLDVETNDKTSSTPVPSRSIVIRRDKSSNNEMNPNDNTKRSREEEHLIMKKSLLASIGNSKSNSSATTSGVETGSKNSSNSDAILGNADHLALEAQSHKVNELKNRLFITEIELSNERKKLSQEKELKKKLVAQLKIRHETEKAAALKALEAKLNAEKLYELNKLKEMFEFEKREEVDYNQKSFDSELLNLKLKLRDKSEK